MKTDIKAVIIGLLFGLTFSLGFYFGEKSKQTDIENRANKIKQKECYTQQDIELIIFNKIQE